MTRDLGLAGSTDKLASRLATQIIDEIVQRDWPVGEVIGSEDELIKQYGVSRAVFREGVRIVEHQHVARMRRGPGGGLVVAEPVVDAVIDAAVIYLLRTEAQLDELFEARRIIEELVTAVAPTRVDEAALVELQELVDDEDTGRVRDHRALHSLLARVTGNPALELFVEMLSRLAIFYFSDVNEISKPTIGAVGHAHRKIADAVMAGDGALARRRMTAHLQAEADFIRARRGTRQELNAVTALRGRQGGKRAESIAQEIFSRVINEGLPPGVLLGSEGDLIEQYGVSRAVLREAVRLLEHHRIAAMRRGPGGGLFVVPADASAVCDVVAVYLNWHGVQTDDLAEVRTTVELALIDLVIKQPPALVEERLSRALVDEAEASDDEVAEAVHDVHAVIASLGGNRVLELVARILLRLTRLQDAQRTVQMRSGIRAEVLETHSEICDALIAGERDLAHHRMRRHLAALSGTLQ